MPSFARRLQLLEAPSCVRARGVSGKVINWGAQAIDFGLTDSDCSGAPNAELWLNGKRVTAFETSKELKGASIARVPALANAGTVELALKLLEGKSMCDTTWALSHVLWR